MMRPSVEDRLAIQDLYARYCWALDTGDTDGYLALFTEDAEATEQTREGTLEVRRGRSRASAGSLGRTLVRVGDDQPSAGRASTALVRARARRRGEGR
jgi:SnoaL-like domain